MTRLWIVRPLAQADIDDAVAWYEQQHGLGSRFLDVLGRFFKCTRDTPLQYPNHFRRRNARYARSTATVRACGRCALPRGPPIAPSCRSCCSLPDVLRIAYRRWRFANVTPEPDFR